MSCVQHKTRREFLASRYQHFFLLLTQRLSPVTRTRSRNAAMLHCYCAPRAQTECFKPQPSSRSSPNAGFSAASVPAHSSLPASAAQPRPASPSATTTDAQGTSAEGAPEVEAGRSVSREAARAEEQPAGPYGDFPDKPGHLASAEQCQLANGGVCWHLLQMAVRARQIAQKTEDNTVGSFTQLTSPACSCS